MEGILNTKHIRLWISLVGKGVKNFDYDGRGGGPSQGAPRAKNASHHLNPRVARAGRRPGCLSSASLGQEWAGPIHSAILRRKGTIAMKEQLTAVFQQVPEGYIAFVEELPGANTQGDTLDEARTNLQEAVHLVLESNRALAEESLGNKTVIREPLASIS